MDRLIVIFKMDLIAGAKLYFRKYMASFEHFDVFRSNHARHGFRHGFEVVKASLPGLFQPFISIPVAIEQDTFMLLEHFLQKFADSAFHLILRNAFQLIRNLIQGIGYRCVQDDVRIRYGK